MEDEKNVVDNEVLQNETDNVASEYVDYSEILQGMQAQLELQSTVLARSAEGIDSCKNSLETLCGGLVVIVLFTVVSFCWSCMRQWRKNVLKIGE